MDISQLRNLVREGDCILTASRSLLAGLIRMKTAGGLSHFWDMSRANHAGIVHRHRNGCLRMAEMLSGGLTSTDFSEYFGGHWWSDRVVMLRRNPIYESAFHLDTFRHRIAADFDRPPKYDWKGDFEFVIPALGDNPNRYYCSEFVERHYVLDGGMAIDTVEHSKDPYGISPYGLQMSPTLITIGG